MRLSQPNIEEMRAKNDVKGLIKALMKSDDIRVAGAVEDALEDIGHRTSKPFIEALRNKDADIRSGAAWILGNTGDARVQGPLIAALKDEVGAVRWLAVTALGGIGDERAITSIGVLPTDADEPLKQIVADALKQIKSRYQGVF